MIKIEQVEKILSLKCEGENWDFKQEWYQTNKLDNLVHDIICMANNQCDCRSNKVLLNSLVK